MPRATPKVFWTTNTLTPGLAQFVVKANVAIAAAAREAAESMEQWMRDNAPWDDRTGDARAGLSSLVESHGFRQEIYLYHTVEYGLWLEVRWNGRYAIIQPTIEHFSAVGMQQHFDHRIMAAGAIG